MLKKHKKELLFFIAALGAAMLFCDCNTANAQLFRRRAAVQAPAPYNGTGVCTSGNCPTSGGVQAYAPGMAQVATAGPGAVLTAPSPQRINSKGAITGPVPSVSHNPAAMYTSAAMPGSYTMSVEPAVPAEVLVPTPAETSILVQAPVQTEVSVATVAKADVGKQSVAADEASFASSAAALKQLQRQQDELQEECQQLLEAAANAKKAHRFNLEIRVEELAAERRILAIRQSHELEALTVQEDAMRDQLQVFSNK